MLTNAQRIAGYFKQNGSNKLTPAQQRRVNAKANRERDPLAGYVDSIEKVKDDHVLAVADKIDPPEEHNIGAAQQDKQRKALP